MINIYANVCDYCFACINICPSDCIEVRESSMQKLTDEDINDNIAQKVESFPNHKRTLTFVFKAAEFKKPSLIIDVMKAFSGV